MGINLTFLYDNDSRVMKKVTADADYVQILNRTAELIHDGCRYNRYADIFNFCAICICMFLVLLTPGMQINIVPGTSIISIILEIMLITAGIVIPKMLAVCLSAGILVLLRRHPDSEVKRVVLENGQTDMAAQVLEDIDLNNITRQEAFAVLMNIESMCDIGKLVMNWDILKMIEFHPCEVELCRRGFNGITVTVRSLDSDDMYILSPCKWQMPDAEEIIIKKDSLEIRCDRIASEMIRGGLYQGC